MSQIALLRQAFRGYTGRMEDARILSEGNYLGLYERDGWEFADRPNATGVVGILPLTSDSKVVLVEQFRKPVNATVIEIPAGLVGDEEDHRDESLAESARRELLEETGFEAGAMKLLLSTPTSAGMTPEITHLFLATDLHRKNAGGGVAGEEIKVHQIPLQQLHGWLRQREGQGMLVDSKIHATLWLAGRHDHGLQ